MTEQISLLDLDSSGKRKELDIIKDQNGTLLINGKKVTVRFNADYFGKSKVFYAGMDYVPHLEIDGQPNIITDTGYRSHFFGFWVVEESKTFEEMIEKVLGNEFKENKIKIPLVIKWL